MAGAAGTATAGGLTVALLGTLRADLPHTLGGTCITLVALTVLALTLIRRWIVDTSAERHLLATAQREALDERGRYVAAQLVLEAERGRLAADLAAERRKDATRLKAEREAMRAEFEEKKAQVVAETMEATVRSMLRPPAPKTSGTLIEFPRQHAEHQPQPERARTRDH